MLSIFPIMFLSLVAHAILRVGAGLILVAHGARHLKASRGATTAGLLRTFGVIELLLGGFLTIGLWTQAAALLIALFAIMALVMRKRLTPYLASSSFYLLLIAASLSLVITGAGALAIDMPF